MKKRQLPHPHLCRILNRPQSHYTHNSIAGKHLQNQNTVIPHLQMQLERKNYLQQKTESMELAPDLPVTSRSN